MRIFVSILSIFVNRAFWVWSRCGIRRSDFCLTQRPLFSTSLGFMQSQQALCVLCWYSSRTRWYREILGNLWPSDIFSLPSFSCFVGGLHLLIVQQKTRIISLIVQHRTGSIYLFLTQKSYKRKIPAYNSFLHLIANKINTLGVPLGGV